MKKINLKFIKNYWTRIIAVSFFILLSISYAKIFAIGSPYAPGSTLDPACAPGDTNCIVQTLPDQTGSAGQFLTTDGTNTSWSTLTSPTARTSGDTDIGYLNYNGTTSTAGQFDGGTTKPTDTTRLNYDGSFYANSFVSYGVGAGDQIVLNGSNSDSRFGMIYATNLSNAYPTARFDNQTLNGVALSVYSGQAVFGDYYYNFTIDPNSSIRSKALPIYMNNGLNDITKLNPFVTDGSSAVAYTFDTNTALSTSGAKLFSVLNNGNEKFSIDKSGNVNIPTGSTYQINGVPLVSGVTPTDNILHWDSTNKYYVPYTSPSTGGFDSSISNPTGYTRLNYNGLFYATGLYGFGSTSNGVNAYTASAYGVYGLATTTGYGGYFSTGSGTKIVGFDYGGSLKSYIGSNGEFSAINSTNSIALSTTTTFNSIKGLIDIKNTTSGYGITVTNSSTGYGITVTNSSTGNGLYISNGGSNNGSYISNSSSGIGSFIDNSSSGQGQTIVNEGTGVGFLIQQNNSTSIPFKIITNTLAVITSLNPSVANDATAIAYKFNTTNALSTSGAKLFSIQNNGVEKANIDYAGNILSSPLAGVGNRAVYSDANGVLTNSSSDQRLKKNIVTLSDNLDVLQALSKLRGVYYNWDTSNPAVADLGNQREIGMIAQEVQAVMPELVGQNSTGYLSLDYPKLTAYLVEVAKAQQTEIDNLNLTVKDLSSLDTTSATSLGSLIAKFLGDVGNTITDLYAQTIHSNKIETKELCVGSTCVTEEQFLEMVNKSASVQDPNALPTAPSTEDTTPTPPTTTITTSDTTSSDTSTTPSTDTTTITTGTTDTTDNSTDTTTSITTDTSTNTTTSDTTNTSTSDTTTNNTN